ncbi:Dyp-type peroxidase [Streptomyces coeruleorubidus]|uniref:Dyp-type peroxidase n=1 Tax=Streptomyces coeruleorubidus TaxID=116188 RepID=A0ABZ0KSM7_STRC4|nr:Dyp-type peroxidase [Streptomyces coeruleorubidus]WOT40576.1 Dyp-type peroxidase [Streptomyces coeruleorubidus]
MLRTSVATGAGAVGLATVSAVALRGNRSGSAGTPAHLRGAAPLPFTQIHSFDLTASADGHSKVLRAAHHAIAAIDGGDIAAWLALGEGALPSRTDRPRYLKKMPSFAGDVLDPVQSHGDLMLHITGASADAVRQAAEQALRALPHQQVRWRADGTRPENRTEDGRGLSRNPFHFTEGHGNPAAAADITERATVRTGQGEPSWAVGGSYQVIRIIRLATDFWDRDSVHEQERIIGRRRNGRWLDGTPSTDRAVFATDPHGKTTPLDSHVRRAAPNPRTSPSMVRRSYNYNRGPDDQGLIFSCFQSDLEKGFEAVQRRLQGEAMAKYTLTTGGGYFFVPPPGDDWLHALAES